MRAIAELLNTVLGELGLSVGPWVMPALAVGLALLLLPLLRANHATRQARRRLSLARSAPRAAERERLKAEALALVLGNRVGVAVVAEEALRHGWTDLAQQALVELERSGGRPEELRGLRRRLEGQRPPTATAEALVVERLLEAGLREQAAARLEGALARWPEHPELVELRGRV